MLLLFHPLLHPQLNHNFLLFHLRFAIISYLILHQKYYLQLQVLLYMLRNTLLKKCKITSCRTSRGMWVNTSEFAGKDNNETVSCRYYFLTLFMQLWIFLFLWYYYFCHLYYTFLLSFFLSGANKKLFKRKSSLGRKCCQLKGLRVLLVYLFSHY